LLQFCFEDVRSLQLFASTLRIGFFCNFLNEVSSASSDFTFVLSEGGQFILRIADLLFHCIFRFFETAAFDSTFFRQRKTLSFRVTTKLEIQTTFRKKTFAGRYSFKGA
jgi:hypothetical protein